MHLAYCHPEAPHKKLRIPEWYVSSLMMDRALDAVVRRVKILDGIGRHTFGDAFPVEPLKVPYPHTETVACSLTLIGRDRKLSLGESARLDWAFRAPGSERLQTPAHRDAGAPRCLNLFLTRWHVQGYDNVPLAAPVARSAAADTQARTLRAGMQCPSTSTGCERQGR